MNDKKHGYGVCTWPDGKIYAGGWLDGKQHGKAKFTNAKGKSRDGIWENGERKEWIESGKGTGRGDSHLDVGHEN